MPTELEIRKEQKILLFKLLKLKQDNSSDIIGLEEWILEVVSGMMEEDVALVEKNVEKMLKK